MPKYIGSLNYDIIDSNEDPLTLGMMGYSPYEGYENLVSPSVDANYHPFIPDPVKAYNPAPTTTSTKVPIKNEYTGEDVNYEIPMGFNPTQYAVNNPGTTKDTAFQDYLTNTNNKGWGGAPVENTYVNQMVGPTNLPSEGGFGFIPAFGGDITPEIAEALKSYPQYYDAFDPSKWDVGSYNFINGGTTADPSQGWADTAAMRNKDTGEWLSFANAYRMFPHEAAQVWDMYQGTKGRDNWFESDFLKPVLKGVASAIPTIALSAAGNYILPGIGGAIGGAAGGVMGNSIAGNPVSWSNWKDQVVPAVAGGVAGYYGGDWMNSLEGASSAVPSIPAESLAVDASLWDRGLEWAGEALSAKSPQIVKDAAMFLGSSPRDNPMYDLEKDWAGQTGMTEIANLANRSSNQIGTDFMNTATGLEQDKAFNMYASDLEAQHQEMLAMREQEYLNQQRAYEEYLNEMIPRMQQSYTYTSPFDYKVPDTSNVMPGETLLTEEDTPNVYYGPETTYRQQQSELARRGIRRGDRNTRAFI